MGNEQPAKIFETLLTGIEISINGNTYKIDSDIIFVNNNKTNLTVQNFIEICSTISDEEYLSLMTKATVQLLKEASS